MPQSKTSSVFSGKVTSKGQVTIPVEVRKRLGIHQGDELEFDMGGATTELRVRRNPPPFSQWLGVAKGTFPGGMAEINAWIREMRGELVRDDD